MPLHLDDLIINNILSWLPGKNIINCRAVSRSFERIYQNDYSSTLYKLSPVGYYRYGNKVYYIHPPYYVADYVSDKIVYVSEGTSPKFAVRLSKDPRAVYGIINDVYDVYDRIFLYSPKTKLFYSYIYGDKAPVREKVTNAYDSVYFGSFVYTTIEEPDERNAIVRVKDIGSPYDYLNTYFVWSGLETNYYTMGDLMTVFDCPYDYIYHINIETGYMAIKTVTYIEHRDTVDIENSYIATVINGVFVPVFDEISGSK